MPINEESKQAYLEARQVFVESYKDFLRKLLGLLYDAEANEEFAHAKGDVTRFADEVKILQSHINDYMTKEQRAAAAGGSPSSSATPRGISSQDDLERASSPGEQQEPAPQKRADEDESTPVPLLGTAGMQTTTSDQDPQKSTTSKSKESTSHDSADELQAEVESQPSQVSPEPADEAPVILPPPLIDDGRVVSAFCAFRYHKAEFRQMFMRQGSNNNSCCTFGIASSAHLDNAEQSLLSPPPPDWVGPLAHCALRLMRSAFRDAEPEAWESLKRRLTGFGFKPEVHFALWLRLSTAAADTGAVSMDPVDVFNAIPPLASLPKRLAAETEVMLQTLNLLSQ